MRTFIQLVLLFILVFVLFTLWGGRIHCFPGMSLDGNGLHWKQCATWTVTWTGGN